MGTANALEILQRLHTNDQDYEKILAEERVKAQAARLIYTARTEAGLTQRELAERIGTQQPAIARLEDADYNGHTLAMLEKIALALNMQVEIRFVARPGCNENSTKILAA